MEKELSLFEHAASDVSPSLSAAVNGFIRLLDILGCHEDVPKWDRVVEKISVQASNTVTYESTFRDMINFLRDQAGKNADQILPQEVHLIISGWTQIYLQEDKVRDDLLALLYPPETYRLIMGSNTLQPKRALQLCY